MMRARYVDGFVCCIGWLGLAVLTGCRSPMCVEIVDLQTGQRHGVPFLSGGKREMIVRVESSDSSFVTYGAEPEGAFLRSRDMQGSLLRRKRISIRPFEGYSALDASHWVMTENWEKVIILSWLRDNASWTGEGERVKPPHVLEVYDVESGSEDVVPIEYVPAAAIGYDKGVFDLRSVGGGDYWLFCHEYHRDSSWKDLRPSYVSTFRCDLTGQASRLFQHPGIGGGKMVASGSGTVAAYAYDAPGTSRDRYVRTVSVPDGQLLREVSVRGLGLRWVNAFALDAEGRRLAVTGPNSKDIDELHICDLVSGASYSIPIPAAARWGNSLYQPLFLGSSQVGVELEHSGLFRDMHDQFLVIDLDSRQIVKRIKGYRMQRFFATPDGRYVLFQTH